MSSFQDALRESILAWLEQQRWFGGKGRPVADLGLFRELPFSSSPDIALQILRIAYRDGEVEFYLTAWPTAWRPWADATVDATPPDEWIRDHDARQALWRELTHGDFPAWRSTAFVELAPTMAGDVRLAHFDQSNTCLIVDDAIILKLYRKPTLGINPDAEIGRFLAARPGPAVAPPLHVVLETRSGEEAITLGTAHRFLTGSRSAWDAALEGLAADLKTFTADAAIDTVLSASIAFAERLGTLTAQMHDLLADSTSEEFAPIPWTRNEREQVAAGQIAYSRKQLDLLAQRMMALPSNAARVAAQIEAAREALLDRFDTWRTLSDCGRRIRIHGDYHLGQVLTVSEASDERMWVLDFEGEPARPLSERRHKRSPLQDVAGMIRSLHYALCQTRLSHPEHPRAEDFAAAAYPILQHAYVTAYRSALRSAAENLPDNERDLKAMLDCYILEKAIYELGYELMNRPDWALVPLLGIQGLLTER